MKTVTLSSLLNCKNLRADFPKMRDSSYDAAIKAAAYVSNAIHETGAKQFFLSFNALKKVIPLAVVRDLTIVGPRLMDFQSVVQEASGLGVVMVNNGLWFFNMVGRRPQRGKFGVRTLAADFEAIVPESLIYQFVEDDEPVDDGE